LDASALTRTGILSGNDLIWASKKFMVICQNSSLWLKALRGHGFGKEVGYSPKTNLTPLNLAIIASKRIRNGNTMRSSSSATVKARLKKPATDDTGWLTSAHNASPMPNKMINTTTTANAAKIIGQVFRSDVLGIIVLLMANNK